MDVFTAVAEPTRRDIIEMLSIRGTLSATSIYNEFEASPPAISQHLKVLREAGLVTVEKDGQHRMYQVNEKGILELEVWTQRMTALWNRRFDALEGVLETEKKSLGTKKRT